MSLYACVLVCSATYFLRVWASRFFSSSFFISIFGDTRVNVCAFMRGGWQENESMRQRHALYVWAFVYVNVLKCVYVWFLCAKCMSERVCVGGVGVWLWNMCIVCVCGLMDGWVVGICVCRDQRALFVFVWLREGDIQCRRKQRGEGMYWWGDGCSHTNTLKHTTGAMSHFPNGGIKWYALIKQTSAHTESNLVWLHWFGFVIVELAWNQNWFFLIRFWGLMYKTLHRFYTHTQTHGRLSIIKRCQIYTSNFHLIFCLK